MYETIITKKGQELLAKAISNNTTVKLRMIKLSDYAGALDENMSVLTGLKHEQQITAQKIDANNPNTLIIESLIPADIGGFYINTIGVYTNLGELFALARINQTYKPLLSENLATDLHIKLYLQVSNAASVVLNIDPGVVLASREYVKEGIDELKSVVDNNYKSLETMGANLWSDNARLISSLFNEIIYLKKELKTLKANKPLKYGFKLALSIDASKKEEYYNKEFILTNGGIIKLIKLADGRSLLVIKEVFDEIRLSNTGTGYFAMAKYTSEEGKKVEQSLQATSSLNSPILLGIRREDTIGQINADYIDDKGEFYFLLGNSSTDFGSNDVLKIYQRSLHE